AYVPEPDCSGFLLHLSTLSAHTRNLLAHPRAGLTISEPERDDEDPQTLARVTIQGEIATIPRDCPDYQSAALRYQERLPASVPRFAFGDFLLLRLIPVRVRFIGGFARAYTLDYDGLWAAAQCTS
ncbi:MAG TPA: pyridoxamine 5'-phosphate oxidase family protein, partial [Candidatus Competibacter phosphatis]|nr:pyridoxamine 5'-phosphate oxidase family protein [Candidatus Competibacter phosphatis]